MLTPAQLKDHSFDYYEDGKYSAEEVNRYFGEVIASYNQMFRENGELIRKITILANKVEEYRRDETNIQNALLAAQRSASKIVREAELRAREIIDNANSDMDAIVSGKEGIVTKANSDAQDIVAAARVEAENIVADALKKSEEIIFSANAAAEEKNIQTKTESEEILSEINNEAMEILAYAKKEAEEVLAEARKHSEELIAQADSQLETKLSEAQAQASELVSSAQGNADSITDEAKKCSDDIMNEAKTASDNIIAQANSAAEAILADAQAKAQELLESASAVLAERSAEAESIQVEAQRNAESVALATAEAEKKLDSVKAELERFQAEFEEARQASLLAAEAAAAEALASKQAEAEYKLLKSDDELSTEGSDDEKMPTVIDKRGSDESSDAEIMIYDEELLSKTDYHDEPQAELDVDTVYPVEENMTEALPLDESELYTEDSAPAASTGFEISFDKADVDEGDGFDDFSMFDEEEAEDYGEAEEYPVSEPVEISDSEVDYSSFDEESVGSDIASKLNSIFAQREQANPEYAPEEVEYDDDYVAESEDKKDFEIDFSLFEENPTPRRSALVREADEIDKLNADNGVGAKRLLRTATEQDLLEAQEDESAQKISFKNLFKSKK